MEFRFATAADAPELAAMNAELVRDEGHRNRLTPTEFEARMVRFFADDYRAVLFEEAGQAAGYALFRREPEWVYLRQLFVRPEYRRQGIARAALTWLYSRAWPEAPRVRIDVLIGNARALAFWRAVGFRDYCLTMEWEPEAGEPTGPVDRGERNGGS